MGRFWCLNRGITAEFMDGAVDRWCRYKHRKVAHCTCRVGQCRIRVCCIELVLHSNQTNTVVNGYCGRNGDGFEKMSFTVSTC